jgi:hypothetical protein
VVGERAVPSRSLRQVELQAVDVIDQLPKPCGAAAIRRKDQTWQIFKTGFIQFFREGAP